MAGHHYKDGKKTWGGWMEECLPSNSIGVDMMIWSCRGEQPFGVIAAGAEV